MKLLGSIKTRIKRILRSYLKSEIDRAIRATVSTLISQLIEFHNSPLDKRQSFYDYAKKPLENYNYFVRLKDRLIELGINVEEVSINLDDFKNWLNKYKSLAIKYKNYQEFYIEKCLEHYISYTYLEMCDEDIFIDIAAADSPYVDILRKADRIESYRLDSSYSKGIQKNKIGAYAQNTNLPDGFATALALHCAFECFMGNADIDFIKEAQRILKPNGRYLIIPLYLDSTYYNSTSPYCDQANVVIDPEAIKVWRDDSYKAPFSRHYSPEVLVERIFNRIPENMIGKVYFIKNLPKLMSEFKGQLIYCYFMFYCKKS